MEIKMLQRVCNSTREPSIDINDVFLSTFSQGIYSWLLKNTKASRLSIDEDSLIYKDRVINSLEELQENGLILIIKR